MAAARKRGRPTLYGEALAEEICCRIADGASLRGICADPAMPSRETVRRWLRDDPSFRIRHAIAREGQADLLAEECLAIADNLVGEGREHSSVIVQEARLRIDARKWYAAKLAPKRYGERVDLAGAIGLVRHEDALKELE